MKVLFFFFIIGLLLFALTLAFGFSFLRMFFGAIFGTRPKQQKATSSQQKKKQASKQSNNSSTPKIFKREEGEYVEFEEVKD